MSVSVSMPQLGESVTEGTVTRWLKKEGERVERDEPLLEISTDKVDTEIPSPAAGILRAIAVAEDETVAVGAELALIDDEEGAESGSAPAQAGPGGAQPQAAQPQAAQPQAAQSGAAQPEAAAEAARPEAAADGAAQSGAAVDGSGPDTGPGEAGGAAAPGSAFPGQTQSSPFRPSQPQPGQTQPGQAQVPAQGAQAGQYQVPPAAAPYQQQPPAQGTPSQGAPSQSAPYQGAPSQGAPYQGAPSQASPFQGSPAGRPQADAPAAFQPAQDRPPAASPADGQGTDGGAPSVPSGPDGPYVTPLVRKLAAEHGVDLGQVSGTGVGGRVRKQDVLDAARVRRDAAAQQAPAPAAAPAQGYAPGAAQASPGAPAAQPVGASGRSAVAPSTLRGTTEHMSRLRQVIAQRMVESLQTSAQLTTVVEVDVTEIARLRQRAKAEFEAREGVRLTFLPFFALAALEALKVHPKLNAVLDTQTAQVTYHDAEHLGVAVDTDRGLLVPVIRSAGDLNIGGLARKIADLAQRTRAGKVGPDELTGGTFTLTNTGSRGALFDTPIINQPQVAILGTGTVVKRPVVVEDPTLGEVIAVRSMMYLALTYDHRLIDGADAARFLTTVKNRLEEGGFEAELGL